MAYCDAVWCEPPSPPDDKVVWAIIGVILLLTAVQFLPFF